MTSTELKNDMTRFTGGAAFITLVELAKFLGYSTNSLKEVKSKYLTGVDKVGKNYYIPDVAKNIMNIKASEQ